MIVTALHDFALRDTTMIEGEERDLPTRWAVILKMLGHVAFGQPEAGKKPKKKRTYKRRDMVA